MGTDLKIKAKHRPLQRNLSPSILSFRPRNRPYLWGFLFLWVTWIYSTTVEARGLCGTPALQRSRDYALLQKPAATLLDDPVGVGTSMVFLTWNFRDRSYEDVSATCRKVGQYCYVFVADDQWNTRVSQPQIDELLTVFDNQTAAYADRGIYEVVTNTFGTPPDVDNDSRIILLLLDIQDGFEHGSDTYYAGYFDKFDQASGNLRDMLY